MIKQEEEIDYTRQEKGANQAKKRHQKEVAKMSPIKSETPGSEAFKNSSFSQRKKQIGKRQRRTIDDDDVSNLNLTPTPGQQITADQIKQESITEQADTNQNAQNQTPQPSKQTFLQISSIGKTKSKNLHQKVIKSFYQAPLKGQTKLAFPSAEKQKPHILPVTPAPVLLNTFGKDFVKDLLAVAQTIQSPISLKNFSNNKLEIEFVQPETKQEEDVNKQLMSQMFGSQKSNQVVQAPNIELIQSPAPLQQSNQAENQIQQPNQEQVVQTETESNFPQAENLNLYAVGQRLATVNDAVTSLEKMWQDKDKREITTSGCKTFVDWVNTLAQKFQEGEFQSSQNLKAQECLEALIRFCSPKKQIKYLTNYKDYQAACQQPDKAKKCQICYKWLSRIRNTRHNTCFDDSDLNSYRMPCYKNSYFCLLCVEIYPCKEELAKHYVDQHHPLDIKFIGLNVILIQRQGPETRDIGRDLVTTANRAGWPPVGHDGKSHQLTPLSTHLTSGNLVFSMLEDYCEKNITFNLPRSSAYEVVILPNKIVYSYRPNVFQEFLFAGGGLEQVMTNLFQLGKLPDFKYYGFDRLERCTAFISFIKPLIGVADRTRFRPFRNLQDELRKDSESWFLAIINEVEKLVTAGFYPVEAQNYNNWYVDYFNKRTMYFAPHWMTTSDKIADQLGYATYKLTKTEPEIKLNRVSGLYTAAVLACYNLILVQNSGLVNWNGVLDTKGRFPCFVVQDAEKKLSKHFGQRGANLIFQPLKKMLTQNSNKTKALAVWCIKTMSKVYKDLEEDKKV